MPARQEWLVERLIPFTMEYTAKNAAKLLGESKLVGIGEGTHRAKEMFQAQCDILKERIKSYSCRKIFIEGDQSDIASLNTAIQTQASRAIRPHVAGNMPTLSNDAMLGLCRYVMKWNRDNRAPKDHVSLVGIDIQTKKATELLQGKINSLSTQKGTAGRLVGMLQELNTLWSVGEKSIPGGLVDATLNSILQRVLDLQSQQLDPELRLVCDSIFKLVALEKINKGFGPRVGAAYMIRDMLMASKILQVLESSETPQAGAVVAHNGHISFGPRSNFSDGMGGQIRQRVEDYRVLIQLAGGGRLAKMKNDPDSSKGRSDRACPTPIAGDVEYLLLDLVKHFRDKPILVDIDKAKSDGDLRLLLERYTLNVNAVGTRVTESKWFPIRLPEVCNVILFHPKVSAEERAKLR